MHKVPKVIYALSLLNRDKNKPQLETFKQQVLENKTLILQHFLNKWIAKNVWQHTLSKVNEIEICVADVVELYGFKFHINPRIKTGTFTVTEKERNETINFSYWNAIGIIENWKKRNKY